MDLDNIDTRIATVDDFDPEEGFRVGDYEPCSYREEMDRARRLNAQMQDMAIYPEAIENLGLPSPIFSQPFAVSAVSLPQQSAAVHNEHQVAAEASWNLTSHGYNPSSVALNYGIDNLIRPLLIQHHVNSELNHHRFPYVPG